VTASVGVTATVSSRNQLKVSVLRDVQYSYDEATQYYVGTGGSVTWTLSIVGPFDVRGTAARNVMAYRAASTEDAGRDTYMSYGGGVGYHLTPRARVGVDVDWSRRDSSRATEREFRNHRLFAGLTWGIKQ
jgi:hypothetical protein